MEIAVIALNQNSGRLGSVAAEIPFEVPEHGQFAAQGDVVDHPQPGW
jgi:hypothetical protein